jgi:hypothetical protein
MANTNFEKLSLGERDLYIRRLEEEIKNKKELLITQAKDVENVKKSNKFLDGIHKNYKSYYDGAVKEKQQQYDAMMLLREYLDELIKKEKMSGRQLSAVKRDQKDIIMEMDKITHELKDMIK